MTVQLYDSTGSTVADQVIRGVVRLFEQGFPGRVVGYYVGGSYADQTAVATSDLDLTVVFADGFVNRAEQEQVERVRVAVIQQSCLELDLTMAEEAQLRRSADPMFKLGARLVYGQEIRNSIPLLPVAEWARQRMHAAFWLMINVFGRPKPVSAPLAFPQPDTPFFGYANRMMTLADGSQIATTRNLIRVTSWIATARIAHEAHEYVIRKRDCVAAYRTAIGDEWTSLLEEIDQRCRTTWQYRVPSTATEQAELRAILHDTLAFENHFLTRYHDFLLIELTGSDCTARWAALRLLDDTFYKDHTLLAALRQLQSVNDPDIQLATQRLTQEIAL